MPAIRPSLDLRNSYDEMSVPELYSLLKEGLEAEKAGAFRPFRDVISDLRERLAD